jgi:hypothetical protein
MKPTPLLDRIEELENDSTEVFFSNETERIKNIFECEVCRNCKHSVWLGCQLHCWKSQERISDKENPVESNYKCSEFISKYLNNN